MLGNIQEAKARGGIVIALTNGRQAIAPVLDLRRTSSSRFRVRIRLLTPILMVIPLQLLGVPHRGSPRVRRRPAPEPREERHGRMKAGPKPQRHEA